MKKLLIFFTLAVTSAFALEFMPPEIVVKADGSTNYEGIHCAIEKGKLSDGIIVKLTFDKGIAPKWADLFLINPQGETILCCGVEGRDEGNKLLYRLDVGKQYIKHSELWIFTNDKRQINFHLKQFE